MKKEKVLLIVLGASVLLGGMLLIRPSKPRNEPLIARVDSSILIIDLEQVLGKGYEKAFVLHYSINGFFQTSWFQSKEEVFIYIKYLKTLGYVDYGWNKLLADGIVE